MTDHTNTDERVTRRATLLKLGGAVATLGAGAWQARSLVEPEDASAGPAAVASGLVSCVLTPEQTEGPYFLEGDRIRRNVTEGRKGVPLALRLGVVDVSTCKPIKGAAMDIWHCDATGVYSGVAQQGTESQTFLRGIQRTNARGVATFQTIYPGWYRGRTVHIHTRVYLGENIVHTGQLYFPDAVTDVVYRRSPYNARPNREPRNGGDSIFRNGGSKSLLKLTKSGSGYIGSLTMGVQRS
jgi:protocatechuate 3,4-dioxygenase beta subunit